MRGGQVCTAENGRLSFYVDRVIAGVRYNKGGWSPNGSTPSAPVYLTPELVEAYVAWCVAVPDGRVRRRTTDSAWVANSNPKGADAHHALPQKFEPRFRELGIENIHDPQFGSWWEHADHLRNASSYNKEWEVFLQEDRSVSQILDFGRDVMKRYGQVADF